MRLIKSFGHAFRGVRFALKGQPVFLIHLAMTVVVIVAGSFFNITRQEWTAIVFCIGLVFTSELINRAMEKFVDMVHPHWEKKAGKIKDIAAAAVLVSAITALIVGVIIFIPYLLNG